MSGTSNPQQAKPVVVLLSSDLMSSSLIEGAVRNQGAALATANTSESALEAATDESVRLVLIDLTLQRLNLAEWVPLMQSQSGGRVKLAAYGPHVHEKSLEAARQAGCDVVLSRGELDRKIDALLERFLSER